MSKVAIQGNASGSGTFTIAAPNSNTDRTLTLPDEAGTVLTSASDIPASSVTGLTQGITEADIWVLTSGISAVIDTSTPITANLSRATSDGQGYIGTGMSESSGVFTFPSTGIWLVTSSSYIASGSSGAINCGVHIWTSTNGSSFDVAARTYNAIPAYGDSSNYCHLLFDVTNTATHKVKFYYYTTNTSTIAGTNTANYTSFSFMRLGDT